jgi:hypothetical protein
MNTVPAPFPALGYDCVTQMDAVRAAGLKGAGMAFCVRYLGSITPSELAVILDAGLLVSLVTYADKWTPEATVAELTALDVPHGVTIWLDVESVNEDAATVTSAINAWAAAVSAGGWQPGLYVGANQPLNAEELYQLNVVRYWRSMSNVPTPSCGWCLMQLYKTVTVAGTEVDVDCVQYDFQDRMASMIGS